MRPRRISAKQSLLIVPLLSLGCVLPIAPEFEEERNQPPFVIEALPAVGTVVTDLNARFTVTVEDPNRNDTLFARWLIDYPPFSPEVSRSYTPPSLPSPGLPNRHSIAFQPSCSMHNLSPSLTRHQLILVVADRPFIEPPAETPPALRHLDETPKDAFAVRLAWTFDKLPCTPPQ